MQTINFTTIAELSSRLELRIDLLKDIIQKYLHTVIHCKIEGNNIYNTGYVRQLEALVFGTLKGACFPVSLRHLAKRIHSDMDWIKEKIEYWCRQGKLEGVLYISGGLFIPRLFEEKRLHVFEEYYLRNRYIDYRFLKDLYVLEPQKYCQEHLPSSILLSSCAVHPGLLSFVESSSMDAIRNGHWLDWNMLLPAHWKESDRRILFSQTVELKNCCATEPLEQLDLLKKDSNEGGSGLVIRWRWIFSTELIRKFYNLFYDLGMKEAQRALKKEHLLGSGEFHQSNSEAQVPKSKKKKKGKGKEENAALSETQLDFETTFSQEQFFDTIRQQPELEEMLGYDALGNCSEEDLLQILVEDIFSKSIEEIQRDVIRKAREQLMLEAKEKDEKIRLELWKLLQQLHFYSMNLKRFAVQLVGEDERDALEQIDSYICRTLGNQVIETVVIYLSFNLGLKSDGESIPSKEWKSVVEKLPPYMQECVKQLQALCRSESSKLESFRVVNFLQEYREKFKNSEIPIVQSLSSEEVERFQQEELQRMKTALEETAEAPDVLSKCLRILLAKYFDVFLVFPGKSIPKLVKIVEKKLQSCNCDELQRVLLRLQETAVNNLRTQNVKYTQEGQIETNAEEEALVINQIKELLIHTK